MSLRVPAASVLRVLAGKGTKTGEDKLQIMNILNLVGMLEPLEAATRSGGDDTIAFRAAIGSLLQVYGSELVSLIDNVSVSLRS